MCPLAGRLSNRVGSRLPMTVEMLVVALALGIQSRLTVHTGYGLLLPGFILMGLGMGLVMSPMHGGDERRGPHQGRGRLRRALDEPDGRRQHSAWPSWGRS